MRFYTALDRTSTDFLSDFYCSNFGKEVDSQNCEIWKVKIKTSGHSGTSGAASISSVMTGDRNRLSPTTWD